VGFFGATGLTVTAFGRAGGFDAAGTCLAGFTI
jgi:hypothetical protein